MTSINSFYRLSDVRESLDKIYSEGITRGVYLGFEGLHDIFSFKPFGTTYIYSAPFSGKTELWLELLMNLTELYGWRHAIYSPESGEAHEIFAELISKRARKPFYKNIPDHINETEYYNQIDFIGEYFYIIDPKDKDLTIEEFFIEVDKIEKQYDIKINTTCCDPFNELRHNFANDEGRQDLYIENRLGFIRKNAFAHKRHNVIITHVRDQAHVQTKDGKRFYPPASPREIAGGQAWYRKAMNLISLWRPPAGMMDEETGYPFEENEVHVIIKKYKPKGVGKLGMAKLFYDAKINRYYEVLNGNKRYAGRQLEPLQKAIQTAITPNPQTTYEF